MEHVPEQRRRAGHEITARRACRTWTLDEPEHESDQQPDHQEKDKDPEQER
jgi:hypothetical protein